MRDSNAYILIEILKGKKQCGRSKHKRKDNIKTDFKKVGFEGVGWTNLIRKRDWWMELVEMVMNFRACIEQRGISRMTIIKFSIKKFIVWSQLIGGII